jgi:hypothetical protein
LPPPSLPTKSLSYLGLHLAAEYRVVGDLRTRPNVFQRARAHEFLLCSGQPHHHSIRAASIALPDLPFINTTFVAQATQPQQCRATLRKISKRTRSPGSHTMPDGTLMSTRQELFLAKASNMVTRTMRRFSDLPENSASNSEVSNACQKMSVRKRVSWLS